MKRALLLLCAAAWATAASAKTVEPPYPLDRYESIWKKSPFVMASFAGDGPASSTYDLGGYMKTGGDEFVIVVNRSTQERFFISHKVNAAGQRLVSVSNPENPRQTLATIDQHGEMLSVRFNPQVLESSVPATPSPNGPATPPTQNAPHKIISHPAIIPDHPPAATP